VQHCHQIGRDCPPATDFAIKDSIINAFERVDKLYLEDHSTSQAGAPRLAHATCDVSAPPRDPTLLFRTGTTAVVAVLLGRSLYAANVGDSRCVICCGGEAKELSVDHKPGR
jgi:hypothetical protein